MKPCYRCQTPRERLDTGLIRRCRTCEKARSRRNYAKKERKPVGRYPYGFASLVARDLGVRPNTVRAVIYGSITSARISAALSRLSQTQT